MQEILPLVAGLPLLVILPLVGVHLAGYSLGQYTEFPPLTRYVPHAGFSWPVFIALAALIAGAVLPFVRRNVMAVSEHDKPTPPCGLPSREGSIQSVDPLLGGVREAGGGSDDPSRDEGRGARGEPQGAKAPHLAVCRKTVAAADKRWPTREKAHESLGHALSGAATSRGQAFFNGRLDLLRIPHSAFRIPCWGWLGLAFGLAAWVLAWTRFAWFAPLQAFTFSPLWFAYILVVNALTVRRTGRCLMTDRPLAFGLLFPLSAAFWWFFEFLNRFVQNWYYVGIGDLSAAQYVLFATLPFSTVLPAVLSTEAFLRSFPAIDRGWADTPAVAAHVGRGVTGEGCGQHPRLQGVPPRALPAATLALAAFSLAGIGVWPDLLFPLLWIAPLLIMTSLQALAGRPTLFAPAVRGDWRRLYRLALAALICGFFWEMWNYYSLARWIYAVPFVNRFHLFEMPLLGYAGYLPFGLECAVAAELVLGPPPRPGIPRDETDPRVQGSGFRQNEPASTATPTPNIQHSTPNSQKRPSTLHP